MSYSWIISLLVALCTHQSVDGSYQYVGCYTQVFHDSFFRSSLMEPILCFRLCDTPIIYLKGTVCRCSGGGLMHHNRQDNSHCWISCPKIAARQGQKVDTCGGSGTYSAYVEQAFYGRHGHLFNYQIEFFSCESWTERKVYDTEIVDFSELMIISSVNRLERCAAACLDRNTTTKAIGNTLASSGILFKCERQM